MNRRRVLGGAVAVSLAGLGAVGLASWATDTKASAEDQQEQTAVVIVDKHVPKGADAATILASTHEGTVQRKVLAEGAVVSDAQVGKQVAAADLYPGDQLVKDRLAAQADTGVPADKVQVSAMLTAERTVGGTLKTGDTVGVYLSFESFDTNRLESDTTTPARTANTTHLEFQHVLVTNVQATADPVSQDAQSDQVQQVTSNGYIVTLALSPEESERFVFASEFGKVWLSNEPATVSDDGTKLVTLGNVYTLVK